MNFNLSNVFQALQSSRTAPVPAKPIQRSATANLGYFRGQAIVEQAIQPDRPGRVRFKNSRWFARCDQPVTIGPNEFVDIIGIQNITLLVEPAFLLSASKIGLTKIEQAYEQKLQLRSESEQNWSVATALAEQFTSLPEAIASETWQRFIQGKPVHLKTFQTCCEALGLNWKDVVGYGDLDGDLESPVQLADASEAQALQTQPTQATNFVGRAEAIADLQRLVDEDAQMILVLGEGGIGKTVLAQQYFSQAGYDVVLECWMARETKNITSAEGVVLGWLQTYAQGETGRSFSTVLEQLRQWLQNQSRWGSDEPKKVGVLIDNLEPALDRNGRFLEAHRGYAELLQVLSDPALDCVVLITSREPLHESTITLQSYPLMGLEESAWKQFFTQRQIATDSPYLTEMHRAYSGNAKAMRILSSTISLDYAGDLEAFWQDHQANLLNAPDLEDLVSSHFNRLQQIYPEAYQLLCRMGCYRFQDVATIPIEGLFCLLWDVPKPQHRSIVRFLRDLFLLEVVEEEYRLHPVIQAKAIALLQADPLEWEKANQKAADFWTARVTTIETVEDALMAAEAYRHYVQIEDWEAAAAVLLYGRDSQWEKQEPLGISFYRLGLLQRMITAISRIIDRLQPGYPPCKLHNILGDLYWLTGNLDKAIACHQKSRELAIAFQLRDLEIQALFNIGLCHIGFWQLPEAMQFFEVANTLAENTEWHRFAVGSWFCLAYLHSCLGQQQQARTLTQKVFDQYAQLSATAWSRGYSLLFLAATLRNLGELEKAEQMYGLAQDYAEQSHYPQVKAEVLNGLAILARLRQDFQGAIANHLAAKQLLDRIEAKGDLAEVNYQLGLTYEAISELGESRRSLQAALQLFEQMNAPKQVERVQQQLNAMK